MNVLKLSIYLIFCLVLPPDSLHTQDLPFTENLKVFVKNTPREKEENFIELHDYLSSAGEADSTKVAAYFLWMTHRIRYDLEAAMTIDENHRQPTIREVLRKKSAICSGYALFFKTLCTRAKIPCQIISGYTKIFPTSQADLKEPDHAWNVVKIEGQWFLIDVTWAASITENPQGFPLRDSEYYFLTPPSTFLLDHLPIDPMWQLLPCPITPKEFLKTPEEIKLITTHKDSCFAWKDSLSAFEKLAPKKQKLQTLEHAYDYNPTPSNGKKLGHAYMDQFIRLSDQEAELEQKAEIDSLLKLYPQLFLLAQKAEKYTTFYDWQKENLAYTYLNYAVALSKANNSGSQEAQQKENFQKMETNLLKAQSILTTLPTNPFIELNLSICNEYLILVRNNLESH